MKLLIVGDIHLADRPPSSRTETYREDILAKLEWIVDKANSLEDLDSLLLLGDVFHIKRPDRNSHFLVQRTAEILGKSNVPVEIVVGNHDELNDSLESIPSQPLGTLCLHPNINLLIGPHATLPLYGIPYVDHTPENLEHWTNKYHEDGGPDKYPFIATHLALFPEAEVPLYDHITYEMWAQATKSKWTAYGHIHSRVRKGPFVLMQGTWFCNNGAISRGSLHEETINRKLAVTIFDSTQESTPFTSVPIPYRPAAEVFLLDVVERQKELSSKADAFLDSLGSTELNYLTIEGILEEASSREALGKQAVSELEDIVNQVMTD